MILVKLTVPYLQNSVTADKNVHAHYLVQFSVAIHAAYRARAFNTRYTYILTRDFTALHNVR